MISRKIAYPLGILLIVIGAVWASQATGYFPYPASSFMINDPKWEYIGAATALVGIILLVLGYRAQRM